MKYSTWIHTRHKVKVIPTRWIFAPWPKKVSVEMEKLPVVRWLLLKDVIWKIEFAPYIISTYMKINPVWVVRMNAGRVIALFNHVKNQVEKSNRAYEWTQKDLLNMSDGTDNSHFEGIENLAILHDLMSNGGKSLMECEQMIFSEAMSYLKIKNAYIRSNQNSVIKERAKK